MWGGRCRRWRHEAAADQRPQVAISKLRGRVILRDKGEWWVLGTSGDLALGAFPAVTAEDGGYTLHGTGTTARRVEKKKKKKK